MSWSQRFVLSSLLVWHVETGTAKVTKSKTKAKPRVVFLEVISDIFLFLLRLRWFFFPRGLHNVFHLHKMDENGFIISSPHLVLRTPFCIACMSFELLHVLVSASSGCHFCKSCFRTGLSEPSSPFLSLAFLLLTLLIYDSLEYVCLAIAEETGLSYPLKLLAPQRWNELLRPA